MTIVGTISGILVLAAFIGAIVVDRKHKANQRSMAR